jgi:hypothetical protein
VHASGRLPKTRRASPDARAGSNGIPKRARRYIEQLPDTIENAVTAMLG